MILVYVDDIIVIWNNVSYINQLIKDLNLEFSLKDLGKLHFFLGVEVHKSNGVMQLTQSKYI